MCEPFQLGLVDGDCHEEIHQITRLSIASIVTFEVPHRRHADSLWRLICLMKKFRFEVPSAWIADRDVFDPSVTNTFVLQ